MTTTTTIITARAIACMRRTLSDSPAFDLASDEEIASVARATLAEIKRTHSGARTKSGHTRYTGGRPLRTTVVVDDSGVIINVYRKGA